MAPCSWRHKDFLRIYASTQANSTQIRGAVKQSTPRVRRRWRGVMCRCVAACCSVLQRVTACCSVLQCVAACCSVLQHVAVCIWRVQLQSWYRTLSVRVIQRAAAIAACCCVSQRATVFYKVYFDLFVLIALISRLQHTCIWVPWILKATYGRWWGWFKSDRYG